MKISILTQWYPPEPAYLMHELAQDLQALGHDIQVITGFPNYPSGSLEESYRLRPWMRERRDGIDVLRTYLYPDHSRSGLKRAINYISFALSAGLLSPILARRPEVLFVYHPPLTVGIPAYLLSRVWRVPFVYQIQDMWPETLRATGMLRNERLLAWINAFARWLYEKANAICVISPGFRNNLLGKGVPAGKIHVVSNWVDTEVFYPAQADAGLAEELGLAGRFNIMFAGNIGEAQALQTVLDAAALVEDLDALQFVFVGDGVALPQLQAIAAEQELSNVRFLGRYPASFMVHLYALSDILLLHLKDDPLFRITIPHKLFAYMASGKPILAGAAGDVADLLSETRAGIAVPPQDAPALAAAVRDLYHLTAEERAAIAERGLQSARCHYSRKALIGEIEQILLSQPRATVQGNSE